MIVDKEFKNALSKTTILYIEDDEHIREYIYEFLERYNSNIHVASNAEDGLRLYEAIKPDIILADINLPKMSGIELVTKIRKKDNFTRVIISTAYTNKEFTLQAIELNITRYLVKPITSKDLIAALEKALKELHESSSKYFSIDLGEGFSFNIIKEQLYKDGKIVDLRRKELELLKFFVTKDSQTITYDMLENEIWDKSVMTLDAIRSQIKNIRKKTYSKIVSNVSGIGYKIYKKE